MTPDRLDKLVFFFEQLKLGIDILAFSESWFRSAASRAHHIICMIKKACYAMKLIHIHTHIYIHTYRSGNTNSVVYVIMKLAHRLEKCDDET